jgi:hypothetical protein
VVSQAQVKEERSKLRYQTKVIPIPFNSAYRSSLLQHRCTRVVLMHHLVYCMSRSLDAQALKRAGTRFDTPEASKVPQRCLTTTDKGIASCHSIIHTARSIASTWPYTLLMQVDTSIPNESPPIAPTNNHQQCHLRRPPETTR